MRISKTFLTNLATGLMLVLSVSGLTGRADAREGPVSGMKKGFQTPEERIGGVGVYGNLPLSFEANNGQSDGQVRFISRGHRYGLFLTPTEAVLSLTGPTADGGSNRNAVVRMKLTGANAQPTVTGLTELSSKSHYLTGNRPEKWRTRVANYGKVRYEGVYPGIDLVYYGTQRQLEYDFIVSPGADPEKMITAFFVSVFMISRSTDTDSSAPCCVGRCCQG